MDFAGVGVGVGAAFSFDCLDVTGLLTEGPSAQSYLRACRMTSGRLLTIFPAGPSRVR
jgi:hypothetical protein